MNPLLTVQDLSVEFRTADGVVRAVSGMSYEVRPGETLGIIGESGCGKTTSALALLGLLPRAGGVVSGEAIFDGRDLLKLSDRELRKIRGRDIAMVFQDPMTSLHPLQSIGRQVMEALRTHNPALPAGEARVRSEELLRRVDIPEAGHRMGDFPHQWSGGMRQRAMIAMGNANNPKLLIADEPTTALDVTVQAQVLNLLRAAQHETDAAIVLITHDLGVIAEMADRVLVMYAGRVVEVSDVRTLFREPRHPYTLGLLANVPRPDIDVVELVPIPGQPADLSAIPPGCPFHPRCQLRNGRRRCVEEVPALAPVDSRGHQAACHFSDEMAVATASVVATLGADITKGGLVGG